MSHILLLTNSTGSSVDILPALELLNHRVHILPAEPTALLETDPTDIVFLDARKDLVGARSLTQLLKATGLSAPLMLILTEGGMAAVSSAWSVDDIVLDSAGPAEVEARIRLAMARSVPGEEETQTEIRAAGVVIDEASYTARVGGAAPGTRFYPPAAADRGLGLRLLRRNADRGRPHPSSPGEIGSGPREPHQHGPQRGLPVDPGASPG